MCPTGDKYKYMYKLSISYEEIYISMRPMEVCVIWEKSINMCPTGDRNKNKSAISVSSE